MKYLIALLIDEAELVDEHDQPLTSPEAVLDFMRAEFGPEDADWLFGVVGPGADGNAAQQAFEQLPGLLR